MMGLCHQAYLFTKTSLAFVPFSNAITRPVNVRCQAKIYGVPIISPAISFLMKHLVIGQRQKAPNFSDFYWSPHRDLVSIGQHFVTLHGPSILSRRKLWNDIISLALSLLGKHLVFGQRQKAPNFSAFHRSPHGCLVSIGQHFVTTRVVHLPERTETSLITESNRSGHNHRIGPGCADRA